VAEEIAFKFDNAAYAQLVHSKNGAVTKDLVRRAERLRALAVKQVGKDTGRLARDIRVTIIPGPNGPTALVGSNNKIALIHHNGTRRHPITARPGRTLRFAHRGRIVYARKVMHPGTRPNRYLTDNLRRVVVD
jgi:phage gpG-like protein